MKNYEEQLNPEFLASLDELWRVKKTLQCKLCETSFERHDNTHCETVITYKANNKARTNTHRYKVDCYFFLPKAVLPKDYSAQDFYHSLSNRIRLRNLDILPSQFLDSKCNESPLCQLLKLKAQALADPQLDIQKQILEQAKLAVSQISHSLKSLDIENLFSEQYDINKHYQLELEFTSVSLVMFRSIIGEFNSIFINRFPSTLDSLNLMDEYLSHITERKWCRVLKMKKIQEHPALADKVLHFIREELNRRPNFTYLKTLTEEDLANDLAKESFAYRLSILKKFIQNQLYLHIKYKNESNLIGAMMAAGLAAMFAYTTEMLTRNSFGLSWSYNAGLLIAVSTLTYVLKDRLKEFVKYLWNRKASSAYDMRREIYTENMKIPFAKTLEKVRICEKSSVPEHILRARNAGKYLDVESYREEDILAYSRTITIDWKALAKTTSSRRNELKEIYRFDLSSILSTLDDPIQSTVMFDPETNSVKDIELLKVYHINVVYETTPYIDDKTIDESNRSIFKVRLIIDKKGIKRVNE